MIDDAPVLESPDLRRTALFDVHRRLGAKLVGFGGWEMPLHYESGTLDEHRSCRHDSVVFDVSHLGTVRVAGPDAFDRLQSTLTNDLGRIGPGRAQYTHLLDEQASVVDDIIVWWIDETTFDVMPNASNAGRVLDAVGGADITSTRAVMAVQGPGARRRVGEIVEEAAAVPRFGVRPFEWQGTPCLAAGTGYTGEDGIECSVSADVASSFWEALLEAGVAPAGLGARDTLRLEAALPLHGHELGPGITPLQAGLGWVVGWEKPTFRGRDALAAERALGPSRRLVGIVSESRRPPREGTIVEGVEGEISGTVTSGNFSPMLECGIAMALIEGSVVPPPGAQVALRLRGATGRGRLASTPFVRPGQFAAIH